MIRPQTLVLLLGSALVSTGCVSSLLTVRQTYSGVFQCPVDGVQAQQLESDEWHVEGCGRHALCTRDDGPCREVFTPAERLALAQDRFAKETPCPLASIVATPTASGIIVDGCGRYALCPEPRGPCFTQVRPTCESIARARYDACVAQASAERRNPQAYNAYYNPWNNPMAVAGAVKTVMEGARGNESCQQLLTQELGRCSPPAPQPTAR